MKFNNQNNQPILVTVKTGAALVLAAFCALLFLQVACSAGVLSHCDDHCAPQQDFQPCSQDRCLDDYPVPGKIAAKQLGSSTQLVLSVSGEVTITSDNNTPAPYREPIVLNSPRPAGTFPLLI